MSLNLFVANGRLVKDLELRKSQSGVSNVRFTLAVNRNRKNDQGETEADFFLRSSFYICIVSMFVKIAWKEKEWMTDSLAL